MKKNYKENRPPFLENELNDLRDFNEILKSSQSLKKGKSTWKFLLGTTIVGLGIFATLWISNSKPVDDNAKISIDKKENSEVSFKTIHYSHEAIVQTPFEKIKLDNQIDSVLTNENTVIRFEANSFIDSEGNLIPQDNVTLLYRSFHDVPEIYSSGIPMKYDSAGNTYHFESAGMFELQAEDENGNRLFINSEAPITVEMVSHNNDTDKFNQYLLKDSVWEFKGKDIVIAKLPPTNTSTENLYAIKDKKKSAEQEYSKALKENYLLEPHAVNDNNYAMKVNFKESEFPELKPFKNIIFEIIEEDNFDPDWSKKTWEDIQLQKVESEYFVILENANTTKKFKIKPTVSSADLADSKANFNSLYKEYDLALGGKLSYLKSYKDSISNVYNKIAKSATAKYNYEETELKNKSKSDGQIQLVRRQFTIASFGIWNSDCPTKMPKGKDLEPIFVNINNMEDTLMFDKIFIAEYDVNALYQITGSWGIEQSINSDGKPDRVIISQTLSYNPANKTVIWASTKEGNLAVLKPADFDKIELKGDYHVIPMEVSIEPVLLAQDVKKMLAWK